MSLPVTITFPHRIHFDHSDENVHKRHKEAYRKNCWPISKIVAPISWKGRGFWDHPLSTSATECPNIQECSYNEAAKAYIQVLNTTILKAYLLLQNTEEWVGEVHTLGNQSLERREDHSELILQKYTPPEAQQLHQKSHQKTNVTTSIFFYMSRA